MTRWPQVAALLSLVFALTVLTEFWRPFYGAALAGVEISVFALIATGAGRFILSGLGLSDISESQRTLIGATLGLGVLSLSIFALAAGHLLRGWAVSLVLATFWIFGWTEMRAALSSLSSNRNLLKERPLAAAGLAALLGLVFLACLVPPHQYDELVYHLALPLAYIRTGSFAGAASPVYSRFPQNGEMLFALALLMNSDILAHLFMWLALALCAWWIFEMGKLEAPLSCVLIACLLLLGHPAAMLLSSAAYTDPLAMLWITAAALCFLRWNEIGAARPGARGWLLLSGIFTGLALGTRYYAGAAAGIFGAALLWKAAVKNKERSARLADFAVYFIAATALTLPWLVKNFLNCGDPFFPFFAGIFPLKNPSDARIAGAYFQVLGQYEHGGRALKDALLFFPRLILGGGAFGGGMDVVGALGWPLVIWFFPLGAWVWRKNKFWRGLWWFCAAYGAIWFCTASALRFLVAILPLICLVAASGIHGIWKSASKTGRGVLASSVGLLVAGNIFLFFFVQLGVFRSAGVLLGAQSRDAFLSRRLAYYPCAAYVSAHPKQNDKILIVGEQRSYYVRPAHVASTIYGPNPYVTLANEAENPLTLAKQIKERGFSTLLVVPEESRRLGASLGILSARGRMNLAGLSRFLTPIFHAPGCAVMALRMSAGSGR
ncbi:MAG TPA: phospholipid carrier-dependent glycosyltransferase [Elusimicrobiota bacterium]|nr:phospholipid carrier-dependent glycosyltransferase [Elusimicrobiota bacterium]